MVALNLTVPLIIGTSGWKTLCTAGVPMPGRAKTFSTKITPPGNPAASMPKTVTKGIIALRRPCLNSTAVSGALFARAARVQGLLRTSVMLL